MQISSNYNKTVIITPHCLLYILHKAILEEKKVKCYTLHRMLSYWVKVKLNKNEDKADKFKLIA